MHRTTVILLASISIAHAAESGNPREGLRRAQDMCSECHAVTRETRPFARAVSFETLANTPGMNAAALYAALQTSHRTMPNLVVKGEDAADIIAHILSLKRRAPAQR